MNSKSKLAISAIIILSLIYVIMLILPNYQGIKLEIVKQVNEEYGLDLESDQIKITIFPLPKFTINNLAVGSAATINNITLHPSLTSILKLQPQIDNIIIDEKDYLTKLILRKHNNIGTYFDTQVEIKNMSFILASYPDLKKSIENYFGNNLFNLSCQIVPNEGNLNVHNIKLKANNTAISGSMNLAYYENKLVIKFDLLADNILIKKEKITDLKIVGALIDGNLTFDDVSGKFDIGGYFNLSGDVQKNQYRSILLGNLDFKHSDINSLLQSFNANRQANGKNVPLELKAGIILTPIEYSLSNISSNIDKMSISGDAGIIFIGNEPRINIQLNLDNLNSNKYYPLISELTDYIKSLTQDMGDKDYSKKFIPISKNKQLTNFDITLSNSVIFNHKIDNLILDGTIASGFVDIKNLIYQNNNDKLNGTLTLNTHTIKPELSLVTKSGNLTIHDFSTKEALDIISLIYQNFDTNKASANIDINLDKLIINDLTFDKVNMRSKIDKNAISNIHFFSKIGIESDLNVNATINLSNPLILNAAMAYNNFDISQILEYSPIPISATGPMSLQAEISSNGNDLEELFYKLQIEAEYVAPAITANHFNLDNFIQSLLSLDYKNINFTNDSADLTKIGTTKILDFEGKAKLQKGILMLNDITYSTKYASAALEANIDLYNQYYQSVHDISFFTPLTLRDTEQVGITFTAKKDGQTENLDVDFSKVIKILNIRAKKTE